MEAVRDVLDGFYYLFRAILLFFVPRRLRYKSVANDVVLITGGGSGLGRLFAIRFAQLGSRVVIWDVNESGLSQTKQLVKKFGGQCYTYKCDISDRKEVYATAETVKTEVGNVTILVNNAGITGTGKQLLNCDDDKIERVFRVNALAHYWTCKAFLPAMLDTNSGHIVSIASAAGLLATTCMTDYGASKFAAVGFNQYLAVENYVQGRRNINFTTVCPYYIDTGMFAGVGSSILSVLEPEYVVDEAMSGILTNQDMVIIPRFLYVLYSLNAILPTKAINSFAKVLGFHKEMNTFTGRKEE